MEYDYSNYENTTLQWEEIDPFNPYEYEEIDWYQSIYVFVQQYLVSTIKLILCVLVTANNSLLAYVILKFKRLQTKTNYILLNFAATSFGFSVLSTTLSFIEAFWDHWMFWYRMEYAILMTTTYLLLEVTFFLCLLLGLDWFIQANCKGVLTRYQKLYKWTIFLAYILPIIKGLVLFINCYDSEPLLMRLGGLSASIIYIICSLVSIFINVVKSRRSYNQETLRTVYSLTISNIYYLMWTPLVLMIFIYLFISLFFPFVMFSVIVILALITFLLEFTAFVAPVLMVVALGRIDKNFKTAFDNVFKKSVQNYNQIDDNENLNDQFSV